MAKEENQLSEARKKLIYKENKFSWELCNLKNFPINYRYVKEIPAEKKNYKNYGWRQERMRNN